jgi:hypothetical protein
MQARYEMERAYYEGSGPIKLFDRQVEGLALPTAVLDGLYTESASSWYPGL